MTYWIMSALITILLQHWLPLDNFGNHTHADNDQGEVKLTDGETLASNMMDQMV